MDWCSFEWIALHCHLDCLGFAGIGFDLLGLAWVGLCGLAWICMDFAFALLRDNFCSTYYWEQLLNSGRYSILRAASVVLQGTAFELQ